MTEKTTRTLIEEWFELRMEIDRLTKEAETIKKRVEDRKETVIMDEVECIETFKGVYDWEKIAMEFNPTEEAIANFTEVKWNKLAEFVAGSTAVLKIAKEKFYDQGSKFFQLRLKKEKK